MNVQRNTLVIEIDTTNAARNARLISKELESIERNGTYASKSMDSASVAIRQLAGTMAGLVTVSAAINKIDTYTNLNNQLKLVTNSQEELNTALSDTFAIAQRSAASWEAVNSVYAKYMSNAQTLNLSQEKSAKLTEVTAKAVALSGSTAEAAAGALFQYGQALDGNILRAEEFNSLVDGAGGLLNAMAMGLGVTRGELRQMMLDGKLTGEVMTEALLKASDSVDELFNKTDVTIGQSLTMLSDAITKFTGEASTSSGVATTLSSAIVALSENLDLIANTAALGAIAFLTKSLLSQTAVIKQSIAASSAKVAAQASDAQSQITLAALEVDRTRRVAALAAQEIHLARQELNSATTRQARSAATMRMTQAEIAYNIAIKQSTAAVTAQVAAENALNASRAIGARALTLVGGPIGAITLGVTALSAGYLLFADRTAKANAKLEEQAAVANKASEELQKLEGHQRSAAKDDLAASFKVQNDELSRLHTQIGNTVSEITRLQSHNAELSKILVGVRTGTISYDEALKVLNNTKGATPNIIKKLTDEIAKYEEQRAKVQQNADAQKTLGVEVRLAGNAAQNTVSQHTAQADAIDKVAIAAAGASKELQDYRKQLRDKDLSNLYEAAYLDQGYSPEQAKALVEAQKAIGIDSGILSQDQINNALKSVQIAERRNQLEDNYNQKVKTSNKSQKESNKNSEQSLRDRQQIVFENADRERQMEINLAREIEQIRKAKFSPKDTQGFIANAEARAGYEKELYNEQLKYQLNEWQWSEEEKLDQRVKINRLLILSNRELTDTNKQYSLDSMVDQSNHELALIKLAQETRVFQFEQSLLSQSVASEKYWALQRERIALNVHDLTERNKQLAIANALQAQEKAQILNDAVNTWGGTQAQLNGTTEQYQLDQTRQDRMDQSAGLADAQFSMLREQEKDPNADMQLIAQQREEIWQAHHDRMRAIESNYQSASAQAQLSSLEGISGSITGMLGIMAGEQSVAYKAMFATTKAFAIAQAGINFAQAYSQVLADPTAMTLPQKLANYGLMASSALSIMQNLMSIKGEGFANGGFTGHGGKYEIAGLVHKGEGVIPQEEIRAIGGEAGFNQLRQDIRNGGYRSGLVKDTQRMSVDAVRAVGDGNSRSSSPFEANISIVVENHSKATVDAIMDDERRVRVIIRDEIDKHMPSQMQNPNSRVHKSITQNTTATTKR